MWKRFHQWQGCRGNSDTEGVKGTGECQRGRAQTERSRVVEGGIGILGQRQVTPRWEYDTVRRHVSGGGVGAGGG